MGECSEEGCDRTAAVVLDIPWTENRAVCPAHARTWAQREGVVAIPMEEHEEEWP